MRRGEGKPYPHYVAAALIERLPIEAMIDSATVSVHGDLATDRRVARDVVTAIVKLLADGDPEVVELTELYQGASKALDDAGVPYADPIANLTADEIREAVHASMPAGVAVFARAPNETDDQLRARIKAGDGAIPEDVKAAFRGAATAAMSRPLDLAGRIRWLAQQRPTRLDLQRVLSDRDAQLELRAAAERERDAARREVDDLKERLLKAETERDALLELRGRAAVREEQRPVPEIPIAPLPELIRCTRPECSSTLDRALLDIAAVSVDWFQLDGYWFCPACRITAPWIVALDREKNAHQATIFRLEQARDRIAELERAAAGVSSVDTET